MPNSRHPRRAVVLGAGPAGLTAGLLLARRGERPLVLEADSQVGGLARTVVRDGYRFDLGGHRFYTKSSEVEALWRELLGDELLERPRLSRIHWRGRFIDYPLALGDVVRKVGAVELARCAASYARAALRPRSEEETFEDWVTARFGRRLFELFFRSYTEKVWGVPTSEIRAEWAAQRIRDLSFSRAVRSAITGDGGEVRSLIERFLYPRLGPGQMWEAMAAEIEALGGEVRTDTAVERLRIGERLHLVEAGGESIAAGGVISSLPLRATVEMASPGVPAETLAAAQGLHYRDFITVALVVDGAEPFPDNWIYVHEPEVQVGRIQNFRAWSPAMVPDAERSCLGLEYFCFRSDAIWSRPDAELVELASAEIARLGLVERDRILGGHVVRVPAAYPIYDSDYAERVAAIRGWLDRIPNLQQVGRNGLHRYNNSDHSMLTAIRAVENQLDGATHDIWAVNADSAYLEEQRPGEGRMQPYLRPPTPPPPAREPGDERDEREAVAQSIA